MDAEFSIFKLANAQGFGAKSIHYVLSGILTHELSPNDLFERNPADLALLFPEIGKGKFSRAQFSALKAIQHAPIAEKYLRLKENGITILGICDPRYPERLRRLLGDNAPPILFCKGNLSILEKSSIAVVGARNINDYGIKLTTRIAERIAQQGINVVSGFAKGVDSSAHLGALDQKGTTTMVLSYGMDHLSIKKDFKGHDLKDKTLFISQFLPFEKFSGQNAMTRNKLVCALSNAVIVISSGPEKDDAGKMSGTFDAGVTALNYDIPLFVVKPSLLTPPPIGNEELINRGGIELSNGDELMQFVKELEKLEESPVVNGEDGMRMRVLSAFNGKALSLEEVVAISGNNWPVEKVVAVLNSLSEIETVEKGGKTFFRKKQSYHQASLFG